MKAIITSIAISTVVFGLIGTVQAAPPGKEVFRRAKSVKKAPPPQEVVCVSKSKGVLKRIGPPGKGLRRR
jgi:hypothetical protein